MNIIQNNLLKSYPGQLNILLFTLFYDGINLSGWNIFYNSLYLLSKILVSTKEQDWFLLYGKQKFVKIK